MADTKLLLKILDKISSLEKGMNKRFDSVDERLDSLGKSLAYLEVDTPTREEHE